MPHERVNRGNAPSSKEEGAGADDVCVDRARRGDKEAFRSLVERHERKAYAVALGMLRNPDEALDCVQDAFLRAWKSLPNFEGKSAFSTWLHRIVTNLAIDRLRKERPLLEYDD